MIDIVSVFNRYLTFLLVLFSTLNTYLGDFIPIYLNLANTIGPLFFYR